MPTTSGGAIIAGVVVSVLILLIWIVQLATLADLGGSDAAGNALGEAFAAIEIVVLWVLLTALLIVCGVAGRMPWPVAAAIVLPASGFAALTALDLLADHRAPPFLWPIITPALVPPVVVAFCFWTLLPAMRTAIPASVAAGIALGCTLMLCVAIWPMAQVREQVLEHEADLCAKWAEDFAKLAPDAPLWQWTPFLDTRDDTREEAVLQGIRKLGQRQVEAETMLDRGDFPLLYLGRFDLEPTPGLCEKAPGLLRRRVQPLEAQAPGSRPYADIAEQVAAALAAMRWLVGYGCGCDAKSQAWEAMPLSEAEELVRSYQDSPQRTAMLASLAQLHRKP